MILTAYRKIGAIFMLCYKMSKIVKMISLNLWLSDLKPTKLYQDLKKNVQFMIRTYKSLHTVTNQERHFPCLPTCILSSMFTYKMF